MTTLADRLRAAIDETEAWAWAASRPYQFADEGSKTPEGGVHWCWVAGENWDPVTPDPVTMTVLEGGPESSSSVNLATVEEWPVTWKLNETRSTTRMTVRTYADSIEEMDPAAAGHIIRHDPAAVLRRCAADRKILDEHPLEWHTVLWPDEEGGRTGGRAPVCDNCLPEVVAGPQGGPCPTVLALAEAYGVEA